MSRLTDDALQAHLAAIVENPDDAILSKDLSGTILSWNPGAERLYGYSAGEAIGQSIHLLVPGHLRPEVDTLIGQVASGERVAHHDTSRVSKSGEFIDVSLTLSPIRDAAGTITGASVIARDIRGRLPEAGPEAAAAVAEAVVAELGRHEIVIGGHRCATASVGWALIDPASTVDEVMIRADLASYEAKDAGGNRAVAYSDELDDRFLGLDVAPAATFMDAVAGHA